MKGGEGGIPCCTVFILVLVQIDRQMMLLFLLKYPIKSQASPFW